jgi:hypothetical protein
VHGNGNWSFCCYDPKTCPTRVKVLNIWPGFCLVKDSDVWLRKCYVDLNDFGNQFAIAVDHHHAIARSTSVT